MNRARDDFLSGPALTRNQDSGIVLGDARDDVERAAAALAVLAQERQTIHLGHAHVAEDDVEHHPHGALECSAAILLGRHRIARVRQEETETLPQAWFVIDNENLLHRRTAMGKNILNAAPPSRAPSTQTTPPMSCTDRATIARPRPVPRPGSLVV